ncbi:MAG: ABC transporter permease subunit, partial [Planctomycetota bacterium]
GFLMMLGVYSFLSWRKSVENPEQAVLPGVNKLVEGWEKLTTPNRKGVMPLTADVSATYGRLFAGLGAGIAASILFGVLMGAFTEFEALVSPTLAFLSKVPPTAMMAVYYCVFGLGFSMFAAVVGFSIFFTLAIAIYQSAQNEVSENAINKAQTLGASTGEIIYEVIWRRILPSVLDATRLQIGPAMVFLMAAEYAMASEGMGYRIRSESKLVELGVVYIYLFLLGISGLGMEASLALLRRWWCPWASGNPGLLEQLIAWFRRASPSTDDTETAAEDQPAS